MFAYTISQEGIPQVYAKIELLCSFRQSRAEDYLRKGVGVGAFLGAVVGVCVGVVIANFQGWLYSEYYSRILMKWVTAEVRPWTSTISCNYPRKLDS